MTKSIDEILAAAESPAYRRVVTARIALVPQELRDEHARLDKLLPTLISDTIDAHPDRLATAQRLAEIEAEMDEATVEFKFGSIGHKAWADLMAKHPPTRAQRSDNPRLDYNPDTFPAAAMAATCVEPQMTLEDIARLDAAPGFDTDAWTKMWGACFRANVVDAVPKSLTAGLILQQSGGSATTAVNGASHALSSSAG